MKSYYKFSSKIYDATRWFYLLGRKPLINLIPIENQKGVNILEIGCGTGHVLKHIQKKYDVSHIHGVDFSNDMLKKAKSKLNNNNLNLINDLYKKELYEESKFDVIVLSYAMTIINDYEKTLSSIKYHLKDDGVLAIVDFDSTKYEIYTKFMKKFFVVIDPKLKKTLESNFEVVHSRSYKFLFVMWDYFHFIGKPN